MEIGMKKEIKKEKKKYKEGKEEKKNRKCDECSLLKNEEITFATRQCLLRHRKTCHEQIKYKCKVLGCTRVFSNLGTQDIPTILTLTYMIHVVSKPSGQNNGMLL
jgi:hypothetical protein